VGDVRAAAAEIARTGVALPVVVCGHNDKLRRTLQRARVGRVLGWVDDMPALMHAADVLVENAGGLSSLEGMACGLPLVSYRPLPGHGQANVATMAEAGVTRWVRRPGELGPVLTELSDSQDEHPERRAVAALYSTDPADIVERIAAGAAAETNRRAADRGTPDRGTPDRGTPDRGTPDPSTPDRSAPDRGTPDRSTADHGTPDHGTADRRAVERRSRGRARRARPDRAPR
jgi:hypothetical protein